jgi:hypothetical protein
MKRGIQLIMNAGNQSVIEQMDDATPMLWFLVLDSGNGARSIQHCRMRRFAAERDWAKRKILSENIERNVIASRQRILKTPPHLAVASIAAEACAAIYGDIPGRPHRIPRTAIPVLGIAPQHARKP